MNIVGLSGPIGHGKTAFANALAEIEGHTALLESGMVISEVANLLHQQTSKLPDTDDLDSINNWLKGLPAILEQTVHIKPSLDQIKLTHTKTNNAPVEYEKLFDHIRNLHIDPKLIKQRINKKNKEAYRPILQWLGGYLVDNVKPEIWYDELMRRARKLKDTRLCLIGGLRFPSDAACVRSAGGRVVTVYRPHTKEHDITDPTERRRGLIKPDCIVLNDGTLQDIESCAKVFLKDLAKSQLKEQYSCRQTKAL